MTVKIRRAICLVLVGWCLSVGGCRKPTYLPQVTINGWTWTVELATTSQQRTEGLSGRPHLPEGAGMLFIYPDPRPVQYCMRRCLIPLDIAFITSDLRVAKVYTMAVEDDLAGRVLYPSQTAVQFVLEVPSGALGRAEVNEGDKVAFSPDIPDPAKADP